MSMNIGPIEPYTKSAAGAPKPHTDKFFATLNTKAEKSEEFVSKKSIWPFIFTLGSFTAVLLLLFVVF